MTTPLTSEEHMDLALAAELQSALLPKECPPNCRHQSAAARYRMCGKVGGEFYDFLRINDEQIGMVVGDTIGHGVRAALMMAQIMGFLRSNSREKTRPAELLAAVNRMLIEMGERVGSILSCSMFYALVDIPTGICFYSNAGHPKPLLSDRGTGKTHPMSSHDMLLGVEEYTPQEHCHTFVPGERMVMYTDGIIEATGPGGEQFGLHRLRELIGHGAASGPDDLADGVFAAVDEFTGGEGLCDDRTIVVVDRI